MTYQPVPLTGDAPHSAVQVEDDDILVVMKELLVEIKIMNLQLTVITGEEITTADIKEL